MPSGIGTIEDSGVRSLSSVKPGIAPNPQAGAAWPGTGCLPRSERLLRKYRFFRRSSSLELACGHRL